MQKCPFLNIIHDLCLFPFEWMHSFDPVKRHTLYIHNQGIRHNIKHNNILKHRRTQIVTVLDFNKHVSRLTTAQLIFLNLILIWCVFPSRAVIGWQLRKVITNVPNRVTNVINSQKKAPSKDNRRRRAATEESIVSW